MTDVEVAVARLAPRTPLDQGALARAHARVMTSTELVEPGRAATRLRLALLPLPTRITSRQRWWSAAGLAAVAATVMLVVPAVTSTPATAVWAARPSVPSATVAATKVAWCTSDLPPGHTPATTLAEQRGQMILVVAASDTQTRLCFSGVDDDGGISLTSPQVGANPLAEAVDITLAGGANDRELGAWSAAAGRVAADVTTVIVDHAGETPVTATVLDGYWAAWWLGEVSGDISVTAYDASGAVIGSASRPAE